MRTYKPVYRKKLLDSGIQVLDRIMASELLKHYWTSDGDAMAYRMCAEISGKEFKYVGGPYILGGGEELVEALKKHSPLSQPRKSSAESA